LTLVVAGWLFLTYKIRKCCGTILYSSLIATTISTNVPAVIEIHLAKPLFFLYSLHGPKELKGLDCKILSAFPNNFKIKKIISKEFYESEK
jgi:hypothetical protein